MSILTVSVLDLGPSNQGLKYEYSCYYSRTEDWPRRHTPSTTYGSGTLYVILLLKSPFPLMTVTFVHFNRTFPTVHSLLLSSLSEFTSKSVSTFSLPRVLFSYNTLSRPHTSHINVGHSVLLSTFLSKFCLPRSSNIRNLLSHLLSLK